MSSHRHKITSIKIQAQRRLGRRCWYLPQSWFWRQRQKGVHSWFFSGATTWALNLQRTAWWREAPHTGPEPWLPSIAAVGPTDPSSPSATLHGQSDYYHDMRIAVDGITEEVRTCEAWFQLTFRTQKFNLKAHMWYQLSPFPAPMWRFAMQHHPGNIHQSVATPRYSATPCYVLIQVPNVIDTISKRWRSIKPSILHFPTSFLKQIPTPSRFKFINLYY